ncbi:MAG: hypothetical protein QGH99_04815, partial [Pseudomonadales bacterium]|nr:hypothetical protein [Pseudomonadales bacterium]
FEHPVWRVRFTASGLLLFPITSSILIEESLTSAVKPLKTSAVKPLKTSAVKPLKTSAVKPLK